MAWLGREVLEKLRNLDAYPKPLEDFSVKTIGGAAVSVVSHILMLILVLTELREYLSSSLTEELFVDVSRGNKLKINLDIVVPGISCPFLGLDAVDSSGEQHLQLTHNIFKRRLDLSGQPIEEPKKTEALGSSKADEFQKAIQELSGENATKKCGSCYGAETDELKCCNTCAEVRDAYRMKQWAFPAPDTVEQCKSEHYSDQLKSAFEEGCQIYGYLEVNRVGGSFHIAPGQSFSINHVHVHDVQPFSASNFNMTHRIRHLSFGQAIPGRGSPLDDHKEVAEKGSTMFQYYVKIVPTTYVRLDGAVFHTNQFSVTKHSKLQQPRQPTLNLLGNGVVSLSSGDNGMPGIFFSYELSPMMVRYTETEKSFGHFLTNVCAMVGGVYTVAGILDGLIHRAVQSAQRRAMGKVR